MPLTTTLGVMTLYYNKHKKIEERSFFKQLTILGEQMGMDVVVFTPENVDHAQKRIYVEYYDTQGHTWKKKWSAIPALIFDRCRYQPTARFKLLRRFRAKYPHLTYLNRPLANKWTIHQVLSSNSHIRPHLPTTKQYRTYSDVMQMLQSNPTVYLKPINGTGGRGILRIQKVKNHFRIQGRNRHRTILTPQTVSQKRLKTKIREWQVNKPLLVQKGIHLTLSNGRVHDYRLLMQKNRSGAWEVTGCAGRIGAKRSITSNLHGGGKAVSMEKLMEIWFPDQATSSSIRKNMHQLGYNVVAEIEKQYGKLCELALDIAIDRSGHLWLLEINPKPSREVFSKIGEPDTYNKAMKKPLEYALWLSEGNG